MAKLEDLISLKKQLSSSLLRTGAGGPIVPMARRSLNAATANAHHNVHAVGIGCKVTEGRPTPELCVRVYVVQKLAKSLIPAAARVDPLIAGMPTDVIESPPAFFHAMTTVSSIDPRKPQRPLVAGTSAAHYTVTKGTISCFCRSVSNTDGKEDPNRLYMLSNNHIFAALNEGRVGDKIYQPGPADGGTPDDHLAGFLKRYEPIRFDRTTPNRVDAAIAEVGPGVKIKDEICIIGRLTGIMKAAEGMRVCKYGANTRYTEGMVVDTSLDQFIMQYGDERVALFEEQIRIDPVPPYSAFVLPGDSGSVVVEKSSNRAVGLHFAGAYGTSVSNDIADVCTSLEIAIP